MFTPGYGKVKQGTEYSLIELIINNQSNSLITEKLKALARDKKQLESQLSATDHRGLDPLHIAIDKNNFEWVNTLLSFGSPIGESESFATEKGRIEIASLIRTRACWREKVRPTGINFERTIYLIETGFEPKNLSGKDGVLIFGKTGRGKTTLTNYLLNVNYNITGTFLNSRAIPKDEIEAKKSLGKLGNGSVSETDIPQAYDFERIEKSVLIDMPGIGDTRGPEIEIAAAVCRQHLVKQLAGIRCIIFVCSSSSLIDSPPTEYYETVKNIWPIIRENKDVNLIFIVTKSERGNISKQEIKEKLNKIKDDLIRDDKDEHRSIVDITQAILDNQTAKLYVSNITSTDSRAAITSIMRSFKPNNKEKFNFANDTYFRAFMLCMEEIAKEYFSIKKQIILKQSTSLKLNEFIVKIEQYSRNGNLDGFDLFLMKDMPENISTYLGSYILLVENVEDKKITYKKINDRISIKLYYVRNKNVLEPINISNYKLFEKTINELPVERHENLSNSDNKLKLSKTEADKLITQNSNPKHVSMSFKDYLEHFIKDSSKRPAMLECSEYFTYAACGLLAYFAASYFHLPEKVNLPGMPLDKKKQILATSGVTIGVDRTAQWLWRKANGIYSDFALYAKAVTDNNDEMMKFATDSVSSLKEKIAPLNTAFEQAFLDLKVNKECYKKLAKVLDALDLSEHPNLKFFLRDVNDSLDKFLSDVEPQRNCDAVSQKKLEVAGPNKIRAKL